jgi:hypothetical protein
MAIRRIKSRKGMTITLPQVPNGLPVSRRERARMTFQKPTDLAREAVGCTGVFGVLARRSGLTIA